MTSNAKPPRPQRRRWLLIAVPAACVIVAIVALASWLWSLDGIVRAQFEGKRWAVPATVYARPLELYPGLAIDSVGLAEELRALEYRQVPLAPEPGTWHRQGALHLLHTRSFPHWEGAERSARIRVRIDDGRITQLTGADDGAPLALARTDAARIGHIYPGHTEDRLLLRLDEMPPLLLAALIAVEDSEFLSHGGVSFASTVRAARANLRARRVVQGGSTITQQLVKNFYLTDERTLRRKVREAAMAILLERRYSKNEIIETYINEVYLAQDLERAIHGFGLASQHLFGAPLDQLPVEHQALLVAIINGPSFYNPRRHPERALARRNLVLQIMADELLLDAAAAARARAQPLGVIPAAEARRRQHPAFMDLVQRDLARDYSPDDLQGEGLRIFTTLAPSAQAAAEDAITAALAAQAPGLQAAAVLADPSSGEVLAVVGGREPGFAGFNRALDARRPVGSLIKPAVYLAALQQPARFTLGTLLDDAPLRLEERSGRVWEPRNFDRLFRGDVLLVDALAHSLNVPTIRLGMDIGLDAVAQAVAGLGAPQPAQLFPSYLIGSGELVPIEVAQMYQTLATGGFHTPLRAVRAVTLQDGTRVTRYPLSTTQAFDPAAVHLVTAGLVSAMSEGTGRAAYARLPADLLVAGKTGTTDDTRDSWFAGYGENLLGVVWVGRDDNTSTGLTGATGALPIWVETMRRLRPRPLMLDPPGDIETVWIDAVTGQRSAEGCEGARLLPYARGHAPETRSECGSLSENGTRRSLSEWLQGIFR
ncbi:MAG: penicillin-binding protein 1B [Gammaproteobacteria bacterium]|nr:penicillin-binding protein 1B [Gammaproteobacteria bacterium]